MSSDNQPDRSQTISMTQNSTTSEALDRRLQVAIATKADPAVVSPSGTKFAWRRVWGWDHQKRCRRILWLERVNWFRPLGLLTEYSTYAGSEREHRDKYGRYSWQAQGDEAP